MHRASDFFNSDPSLTRIMAIDDDPFYHDIYNVAANDTRLMVGVDSALHIGKAELLEADVIILDLQMPGMDGIHFLTESMIQAIDDGASFSLLISSGMPKQVIKMAERVAFLCGIDCFSLYKPFSISELNAAIDNLLNSPYRSKPRLPSPDARWIADISLVRKSIAAGEFKPFFQPQIRLSDESLTGFEVLARWEHPERGLLSPLAFMEAIESRELAVTFAVTILRSALQALQDLPPACVYSGRLSINLPIAALIDQSLPDRIDELLGQYNFPPERLVCEITEHTASKFEALPLSVMARLIMAGVTLSLDDFGQGYSGINRLRTQAFSELKLDIDFVSQIERSATTLVMVKNIIKAATPGGTRVVGEGVESSTQAKLLRELGCTEAQGFYYSPPVAADKVHELIEKLS